jgi:glyoxylase-like metal-dependent hydrolase (beta-lactamase superfamily II)
MNYCESIMVERIIVGPYFTNAYIISTAKKECFLIDPGGDPQTILQRLETLNMTPRTIAFTSGYLDHTSAAGEVKETYAERDVSITVGIHEADAQFLGAGAEEALRELYGSFGEAGIKAFEAMYAPLPEPDYLLTDGQEFFDYDFTVIHTPGFSPGSICFYSEERGVLFSGDSLLFKEIGRTDYPDSDRETLLKSVRDKLFSLPPETRVFPGRGPLTSLEREMANNPEFA